MRARRITAYLLMSTVPAALLLVGAELVFRRFQPEADPTATLTRPRGEWARCYRPSMTLGYEPTPGRCGYNRHGVAADHPEAKAAGTYRVLLLGDSLSERQQWVELLERRLAAARPGQRVELWNAGVTGYDTCAELRVLQEKGWRVNPDLVLVQLCVNDFFRTSSILPLPGGRVLFHAGRRGVEMPGWILGSRLLTWLTLRLSAGQHSVREGAGSVARCLARIRAEAVARNKPLAVVVFPVLRSEGDAPSSASELRYVGLERRAGEICRRSALGCLELRRGLERSGSLFRLRRHTNDPWHVNAGGQPEVARLVADHLLQRMSSGTSGSPKGAEEPSAPPKDSGITAP